MTRQISPDRISSYILWGVSAIVIILLMTIVGYFILSDRFYYQQQLDRLQENVLAEQRARLKTELDDAETFAELSHAEAEEVLKREARNQTRQALTLMQSIYEQQRDKMPTQELQTLLKESVRQLRFFEGRGYIFIKDMAGNVLLQPNLPHLEGTSLYDHQDDTGHYITRGLLNSVKNPERSGYSRYRWYQPDNLDQMAEKIAYVEVFEPYNWVVGSGDYIYKIEQDLQPGILRHIKNIRFGLNGYIAVVKNSGTLLASAGAPQLEDIHYSQYSNSSDQESIRSIIEVAEHGGGYLYYEWAKPTEFNRAVKLSLVRPLKHWDWILVAGIYEDDLSSIFKSQQDALNIALEENTEKLTVALILLCLVTLFVAHLFSKWLNIRFKSYHDDIEDQRSQLQQYADSMELSGRIVDSAYEGIAVMNADNHILQVNDAFSRITGYSKEEAIGQNPRILASGRHSAAYYENMWHQLQLEGHWQGEIWNKRKDGAVYPEWLSITAYRGDDGEIQNYIATFTDISRRKEIEEKLRFMAENDPLTELPNRRSLMLYLEHDLATYKRYNSPKIAVMFVDLDRFKPINDTYGHDMGDKVLVEVANRLRDSIRESDTACRIGGDEFILIIKQQPDDAENRFSVLADRLVEELSQPMLIQGEILKLGASIGVAICTDSDVQADQLLQQADQALYQAKDNGRNQAVICYSDVATLPE